MREQFQGLFFAKGAHGGFEHISAASSYGRQDNPDQFKERLRKNIARINALVFNNGRPNRRCPWRRQRRLRLQGERAYGFRRRGDARISFRRRFFSG